jgi:hypothetical protein
MHQNVKIIVVLNVLYYIAKLRSMQIQNPYGQVSDPTNLTMNPDGESLVIGSES